MDLPFLLTRPPAEGRSAGLVPAPMPRRPRLPPLIWPIAGRAR